MPAVRTSTSWALAGGDGAIAESHKKWGWRFPAGSQIVMGCLQEGGLGKGAVFRVKTALISTESTFSFEVNALSFSAYQL